MAHVKTLDMLAASVAAFRHNGNSMMRVMDIKSPVDENAKIQKSNLSIVQAILDPNKETDVVVTQDDIDHAQIIIDDLTQRHTMSLLNNKSLPEFATSLLVHLTKETVSTRLMGIVMWAPNLYETMKRADEHLHELTTLSYGSKYLGTIGNKIELTFTVVTERFHKDFNCWRYNGHDGHGNLISFLRKEKLSSKEVTIKAKIKAHENSRYMRGNSTILNYVKEVK